MGQDIHSSSSGPPNTGSVHHLGPVPFLYDRRKQTSSSCLNKDDYNEYRLKGI